MQYDEKLGRGLLRESKWCHDVHYQNSRSHGITCLLAGTKAVLSWSGGFYVVEETKDYPPLHSSVRVNIHFGENPCHDCLIVWLGSVELSRVGMNWGAGALSSQMQHDEFVIPGGFRYSSSLQVVEQAFWKEKKSWAGHSDDGAWKELLRWLLTEWVTNKLPAGSRSQCSPSKVIFTTS